MKFSIPALGIAALQAISSLAQNTTCNTLGPSVDPNCCVKGSGITAFPNCNYVNSVISSCDSPSVSAGAPFISCFCQQALFNAIYGCASENRLCFGDTDLDAQAVSEASIWHSLCDPVDSFTPTTPSLSSITAPYTRDICSSIAQACASGSLIDNNCFNSYPPSSAGSYVALFSSCACQANALSQVFTCEFVGNVSCQQTPGVLSNLGYYSLCKNAPALYASLNASLAMTPASSPATLTVSGNLSLTTSTPDFSPTKPSTATSTPSLAGTATTKSRAVSLALLSAYMVASTSAGIIIMSSILPFW